MKKLFFISLSLYTSFAFANWNKIPYGEYHMQDPPRAGSAEYNYDFDVILRYQEYRTDADCKAAAAQEFPEFRVMYQPSRLFTKDEIKKYEGFLNKVAVYAAKMSDKFKEEYRRKRPYDEDSRVRPCIKKPGGSKAYPSGHATLGATSACVMAMIVPEKAKDILAWGDYLGELRVIAGVHHPSDIAAGRDLAKQICARLAQESDFRDELKKLR